MNKIQSKAPPPEEVTPLRGKPVNKRAPVPTPSSDAASRPVVPDVFTVWYGLNRVGLVDPQAGVALTRKPGPQYAFDM